MNSSIQASGGVDPSQVQVLEEKIRDLERRLRDLEERAPETGSPLSFFPVSWTAFWRRL